MADVAADEEVDRARGAPAHPLDLRVRRHRRARGDGAAARHGRGRGRRDGRRRRSRRAIDGGYSRLPAYEETTDDIVGLVYLKDLVRASARGEGDEPVRASAARRASSCPRRSASPSCSARCRPRSSTWRSSSTSTAAPPGLVTLEDLLEEIVGEIVDEYDVEEPARRAAPRRRARASPAARRSTRSTSCSTSSCPTTTGTRSAGSCSTCSATCPTRARPCEFEGLEFRAERVAGPPHRVGA